MRPWALVASAGLAVLAFVGGVWLVWPNPPPEPVTLERPVQQARQARRERHAPRENGARLQSSERRKAQVREAPPAKDPQLPPDDRAEARQEFREERVQDINDRLDGFAEEAGWSEDEADDVRVVLVETADHITDRLAAVDRGEITWEEARRELRDYRLRQAGEVRRMLGDEEFAPFVEAMDFGRFLDDQPVRGRIE